MKRGKRFLTLAAAALGGIAVTGAVFAGSTFDFGKDVEERLADKSEKLFGIEEPLAESVVGQQVTLAQAVANPLSLVKLAPGLKAKVVTAGVAGANIDMYALWPNDSNPTHLIACNEQGVADPGMQRITIATGAVATIVTGTTACDGVRRTPWGTVLFSEEAGGGANGGRVYEMLDPVGTTGVSLDRATGVFSGGTGAANLTARPALGRASYEGFALYGNGVIYYGDENRPSTGKAGGAYFKFVPSTPWVPGSPAITNLSQSPFGAGAVFGLRLGKRSGNTDYGQGSNSGQGTWIEVCGPNTAVCLDTDLRAKADALRLSGYYRPEDLDIDRAAEAAGMVKFCGPNTGIEDFHNWGEVICIWDGTLAQATVNAATPEAQFLVMGNEELAMPDNIAYQPGSGNWLVHEDGDQLGGKNNDLWDCLPDGADDDGLSDGCVRVATLTDLNAEWTGGIFDAKGKRFFVSLQHNITGKGVVIEITGWDMDDDD